MHPSGGEFVGKQIGKPQGDTNYSERDNEAVTNKYRFDEVDHGASPDCCVSVFDLPILLITGTSRKLTTTAATPRDKGEQTARRRCGDILLGRHGDDDRNVHGTPKLNALGGGAAAEVFESS